MRGDRSRIHQPGVRRDERGEIARHVRARAVGAREMLVDRRRQRSSAVPRIPTCLATAALPDV